MKLASLALMVSVVCSVENAQASQVTLSLEVEQSLYSMNIQDNGSGFETQVERSLDTLGIRGMQERAAECGGELTITSEPGKGTCISIKTELNHVQDFDM